MPVAEVEHDPWAAAPAPAAGGIQEVAHDPWAQPAAKDPLLERETEMYRRHGDIGTQALKGMPIIGPLAEKGIAAANAAIDPLVGRGGDDYGTRYTRHMKAMHAANSEYEEKHPVLAPALQVGGGLAMMSPGAGAASPVADAVLGAGGETLGGQVARSAASGAGIGAADAALRDENAAGGGAIGAVTGAAGPIVGRVAGGIVNRVRGTTAAARAPTQEELMRAAQHGYATADNVGLELAPAGVQQMAQRVGAEMHNAGFRPSPHSAPGTFSTLDELSHPPPGGVMTGADFDNARQALGHTAGNSNNPTDQKAANTLRRELDDYLATVPNQHVLAGDPDAFRGAIEEARGNYAAGKRLERAEEVRDRAERGAASTHSGGNENNKTRQGWNSVLNSEKKMRGYSDEELAAAERLVRGTRTGNTARALASALGGGGGLGRVTTAGWGGAAGHMIGGPVGAGAGAVAAPVAGYVARKIGEASTRRGVRQLEDMIAMRSPLGRNVVQPARDEVARVNRVAQRGGALASRAAEPTIANAFQ